MKRISIAYKQIAVFDPSLQQPFNDWSDAHYNQGFAWRPGSVSFLTLDDGGLQLELIVDRPFELAASSAARVLVVPFDVRQDGVVEIASIAASEVFTGLPAGLVELTFEHGLDSEGVMWARFYLQKTKTTPEARILRADKELVPATTLIMTAEPA